MSEPISSVDESPANIIIFVADGMGFSHLSAARAVLAGVGGEVVWDRFPTTGWHYAHPAAGFLIDSAASATALATGVPTRPGAVGVDLEGTELPNLFERAVELGYRTGIVTDSYVWDATPAAFVGHVDSREDAATILAQLASSSLELLVGELEDVGEEEVPDWASSLQVLESRFRVFGPDPQSTETFLKEVGKGPPIAAIFEEDQVTDLRSNPTFPDLVAAGLDHLASDPQRPFVLLVESEEPDSASHKADFNRLLRGMEAIARALEIVLEFSAENGETLVVFTSDHETGGLSLSVEDDSNSALLPLWATSDHSGVSVPLFAIGPGAEQFGGIHATWELGRLLEGMLRRAPGSSGEGDRGRFRV
ncbi:MAG: alkaline phosphatase [Deltaproteobacteria bacterium]|nr:alkaline phosphatase [Deltaproteobacteria bacterium]